MLQHNFKFECGRYPSFVNTLGASITNAFKSRESNISFEEDNLLYNENNIDNDILITPDYSKQEVMLAAALNTNKRSLKKLEMPTDLDLHTIISNKINKI